MKMYWACNQNVITHLCCLYSVGRPPTSLVQWFFPKHGNGDKHGRLVVTNQWSNPAHHVKYSSMVLEFDSIMPLLQRPPIITTLQWSLFPSTVGWKVNHPMHLPFLHVICALPIYNNHRLTMASHMLGPIPSPSCDGFPSYNVPNSTGSDLFPPPCYYKKG